MPASSAMHNPDIDQPVPSEALLMKTFQLVKEKLACHEHPGETRWCWVDPHIHHAEHIPLCLNDIQLWATYLVGTLYFRFLIPLF